MFISEKEYKKLLKKMDKPPVEKHSEKSFLKKEFDSLAEENFFYFYLKKEIDKGCIKEYSIHTEFIILNAIPEYKLKNKKFKPDFFIKDKNDNIYVVEMKGTVVKRLQRDYGLRKHLFIEKYCLPNKWKFIELKSEEWTQNPLLMAETTNIFD